MTSCALLMKRKMDETCFKAPVAVADFSVILPSSTRRFLRYQLQGLPKDTLAKIFVFCLSYSVSLPSRGLINDGYVLCEI